MTIAMIMKSLSCTMAIKTQTQKTKIKEELMSIPGNSMKMQEWRMTEDEKERVAEMFH